MVAAVKAHFARLRGAGKLFRQRSRPCLFSSTPAPSIAGGSLKVLERLSGLTELRDKLETNTKFFCKGMGKLVFNILPGTHPICPVMLGVVARAGKFAEMMLRRGVYVVGFSYPVVPPGRARIRTKISAAHSIQDLEQAVNAFAEVKKNWAFAVKIFRNDRK